MDVPTSVTTSLLLKALLDETDQTAWQAFDAQYRPIILAFARRARMNHDDSADVAQAALLRFLRSFRAGQYDPTRGTLQSWIISMARCEISDLRRRRRVHSERPGGSVLLGIRSVEPVTQVSDENRQCALLRLALGELREHSRTSVRSLEAFERVVLQGQPVAVVAQQLGLTAHDVYMARRRITGRLRDIVRQLEGRQVEDFVRRPPGSEPR